MVSSTAVKYAEALCDVASELEITERVRAELHACYRVFEDHEDLKEVLDNPAFSLSTKQGVIKSLAEKMDISGTVLNFLLILLERHRLGQIDKMTEAYEQVLDQRAGVVRVEVQSAHPLTSETQDRLREKMAQIIAQQVKLSFQIDEELIGGVRLQYGSTVFDGTIKTELERLRRQLVTSSNLSE